MEVPSLTLPVIITDSQSVTNNWHILQEAITAADYIAIDLELSGLGDRKGLRALSVEDRYKTLCQLVSTHSILSFGISCYQMTQKTDELTVPISNKLHVQYCVFDILLFCQKPYIIDPSSVKFLIHHGFDFNTQYRYGLPYVPVATKEQKNTDEDYSLHNLFLHILKSEKPVVLHNGLVDLSFLYYHFYAPLPAKLSIFVADLCDMFKGGVYDTKTIAGSGMMESTSYLEYLFHKSWRLNTMHSLKGERYLELQSIICSCAMESVKFVLSADEMSEDVPDICTVYAGYGFCPEFEKCTKSHSIYDILNHDGIMHEKEIIKRRKRKRKNKNKNLREAFDDELHEAKKRLTEPASVDLSVQTESHPVDNSPLTTTQAAQNGKEDDSRLENLTDDPPLRATQTVEGETVSIIDDSQMEHLTNDPPLQATRTVEGETVSIIDDSRMENLADDLSLQTTQTAQIIDNKSPIQTSSGHRAGTDAFATGYYFLSSGLHLAGKSSKDLLSALSEYRNKIALGGKPMPLLITKSQYSSTSDKHRKIQQKILKETISSFTT